MNASEAMARLERLGVPALTTADAAALFGQAVDSANKTLTRLARAGLIFPLRRGLWALDDRTDPHLLADTVTAPFPAYVSLQSALHLRGMIEQIPALIYVASLGRTRRIRTAPATYSIHHLAPELFGGFDLVQGVKLATPEKALVDFFYLSGTKSRLFAALPEVELPAGFRRSLARSWVARIPSARLRTLTSRRLEALLERGADFPQARVRTAARGDPRGRRPV